MPHYNTATGSHESPTPEATVTRSSDQWVDPCINTQEEARLYQERIQRLANEVADPMTGPVRRRSATAEKASLERALPLQLAAWREIDARRAQNGGR